MIEASPDAMGDPTHSIETVTVGTSPLAAWLTVTLSNGESARGGFALKEASQLAKELADACYKVSMGRGGS